MHSIVVKHQRNLIMKEVKEVLRRTVGSDSRFNILSGSHLKSQVTLEIQTKLEIPWMLKRQSPTTVFLMPPFTRTVKSHGFKPFPIVVKSKQFYCGDNQVSLVIQTCCHWLTEKWPQYWEININF